MAPQRRFLNELNASSKSFKVKVFIAEKGRPQKSEKKIIYQYIIVQDDKKYRMKLTLFGDQVEAYKHVILFRGNYDIANALVRPLDPQYRQKESDLPFQMVLGSRTVIQSLDPEGEIVFPKYQSLASIPRVADDDARHDVLVIVLYVAKEARKIVTTLNKESFVRDLMVIDHSTDQPVKVCTWNDLFGPECETLVSDSDLFRVIGITALRPITRKGFQIESTMFTEIIREPEGEKAAALAEWARKHRCVLIDQQNRVTAAWNPPTERILTTIERIRTKKATTTLPQEFYWLRVVALDLAFEKLRAYIGCSHCGKRTYLNVGESFNCIACGRNEVSATYRATITFNVSDGTGALQFTAFTENCIPLLGVSAEDLYQMKILEQTDRFNEIALKLANTYFLIKIGPTTALEQNKVLQWGLKAVVMEDLDTAAGAGSSTTASRSVPATNAAALTTNAADPAGDAAHACTGTGDGKKPIDAEVLSKTIKKETVQAFGSAVWSQEEEDACILAETMAAADQAAQSQTGDSGQKRKRSNDDDETVVTTPAKDVLEAITQPTEKISDPIKAKEAEQIARSVLKGKAASIDGEESIAGKTKGIKQEKQTMRRALVFPNDESDEDI